MESFYVEIFLLPKMFAYLAIGVATSVVGGILGHLLAPVFKLKKLAAWLAVIFFLVSFQASGKILPALEKKVGPVVVLSELKRNILLATILKYHPNEETTTKDKVSELFSQGTEKQKVFEKARKLSDEVIAKYLERYLYYASDKSVYDLIKYNLESLINLRDKPDLCIKYYLGYQDPRNGKIPKEILEGEAFQNSKLIESAILTPSKFEMNDGVEDVIQILRQRYIDKGHDPRMLEKLNMLLGISSAEGCNVAIVFMDVMLSMKESEVAYVFKKLFYTNR